MHSEPGSKRQRTAGRDDDDEQAVRTKYAGDFVESSVKWLQDLQSHRAHDSGNRLVAQRNVGGTMQESVALRRRGTRRQALPETSPCRCTAGRNQPPQWGTPARQVEGRTTCVECLNCPFIRTGGAVARFAQNSLGDARPFPVEPP